VGDRVEQVHLAVAGDVLIDAVIVRVRRRTERERDPGDLDRDRLAEEGGVTLPAVGLGAVAVTLVAFVVRTVVPFVLVSLVAVAAVVSFGVVYRGDGELVGVDWFVAVVLVVSDREVVSTALLGGELNERLLGYSETPRVDSREVALLDSFGIVGRRPVGCQRRVTRLIGTSDPDRLTRVEIDGIPVRLVVGADGIARGFTECERCRVGWTVVAVGFGALLCARDPGDRSGPHDRSDDQEREYELR
jgi:hypothetical protein